MTYLILATWPDGAFEVYGPCDTQQLFEALDAITDGWWPYPSVTLEVV